MKPVVALDPDRFPDPGQVSESVQFCGPGPDVPLLLLNHDVMSLFDVSLCLWLWVSWALGAVLLSGLRAVWIISDYLVIPF